MRVHKVILFISLFFGSIFGYLAFKSLKSQNGDIYFLLNMASPYFKPYLPFYNITYPVLSGLVVTLLIFIIGEIIKLFSEEKPLITRGDAHWADKSEVKDLLKSKGVPLGRFDGKIIRTDQTHIVTCAGTRSGKGIGGIIPALLEFPESLVCLDIKGENYAVTANARKRFGSVFVLNPFDLLGIKTNSYNWLDGLDLSDARCITLANNLASALVGRDPNNSAENHFNEQAITLLQGVILLACSEPPESRNMGTVYRALRHIKFTELCEIMRKRSDIAGGVVSDIGSQFLNNVNERELGSILSTAQRATNFLNNPNIRKTLEKSDFNVSMLPDKIMSVYLIMPQDQINDFKAYIRVFFDLAISSLTSRKTRGKYQVLFLLDELAQIGFLEIIPKAITLLKGMGGQLWLFFQSYTQMENIYGKDADTILGNSTQIFYGCNDIKTAKLISETLGQKTIREYKKNDEYSDIGKDLLFAYEVRKLKPEKPIILMSGRSPIMVKRLNYLRDKEYKGLFDKNPYFDKLSSEIVMKQRVVKNNFFDDGGLYKINNFVDNFLFDYNGIEFNFRFHKYNDLGVGIIITNNSNYNKIKDVKDKKELLNSVYNTVVKNIKNFECEKETQEEILNSKIFFCDIYNFVDNDNIFLQIDKNKSLDLSNFKDRKALIAGIYNSDQSYLDLSDYPIDFQQRFK